MLRRQRRRRAGLGRRGDPPRARAALTAVGFECSRRQNQRAASSTTRAPSSAGDTTRAASSASGRPRAPATGRAGSASRRARSCSRLATTIRAHRRRSVALVLGRQHRGQLGRRGPEGAPTRSRRCVSARSRLAGRRRAARGTRARSKGRERSGAGGATRAASGERPERFSSSPEAGGNVQRLEELPSTPARIHPVPPIGRLAVVLGRQSLRAARARSRAAAVTAPRQVGTGADWVAISVDTFSACGCGSDGGRCGAGGATPRGSSARRHHDRYEPTRSGRSAGWAACRSGASTPARWRRRRRLLHGRERHRPARPRRHGPPQRADARPHPRTLGGTFLRRSFLSRLGGRAGSRDHHASLTRDGFDGCLAGTPGVGPAPPLAIAAQAAPPAPSEAAVTPWPPAGHFRDRRQPGTGGAGGTGGGARPAARAATRGAPPTGGSTGTGGTAGNRGTAGGGGGGGSTGAGGTTGTAGATGDRRRGALGHAATGTDRAGAQSPRK